MYRQSLFIFLLIIGCDEETTEQANTIAQSQFLTQLEVESDCQVQGTLPNSRSRIPSTLTLTDNMLLWTLGEEENAWLMTGNACPDAEGRVDALCFTGSIFQSYLSTNPEVLCQMSLQAESPSGQCCEELNNTTNGRLLLRYNDDGSLSGQLNASLILNLLNQQEEIIEGVPESQLIAQCGLSHRCEFNATVHAELISESQ